MKRRATVFLPALLAIVLLTACATTGSARKAAGPADTGLFPPPPDQPRVQFLLAITADTDIPGARRGIVRAIVGDAPLRELMRPRGVAVHDGVIYVADAKLHTVVTIDLEEKTFEWIHDDGPGKIGTPLGIALDPEGRLYVADVDRRQVLVYAPGDHRYLGAIGDPETLRPTDVITHDGRLYVADTHDHEIEIWDIETRERVGTIGREGEALGEFKYPTFLAAGLDGYLYVTDTLNSRVQKLTFDGKPLGTIGKIGDWTGSLPRPKGIAADEDGLVHVIDAGFENVQIFLPDGRPATFYGGFGDFKGHMYLPFEIAIDRSLLAHFRRQVDRRIRPRYIVLVTNQSGPHKLNIYVYGDPAQPGGEQ